MGRRLDLDAGGIGYDNLVASHYPPLQTFMVTLKGGQGVLKRGTLLSPTDDGMVPTGTAVTTGEGEDAKESVPAPNCVLADDTDTAEETEAIAYRSGHFMENGLIVKDGYTVTDADKETLRGVGILLSDAVGA